MSDKPAVSPTQTVYRDPPIIGILEGRVQALQQERDALEVALAAKTVRPDPLADLTPSQRRRRAAARSVSVLFFFISMPAIALIFWCGAQGQDRAWAFGLMACITLLVSGFCWMSAELG